MNDSDRTCPYCGHRFETIADRDRHVPCPEPTGDVKAPPWFDMRTAKEISEENK